MMRYAAWAMALFLSSIVSVGPAQAGHRTNVAIVATFGQSPFFFHQSPFFFRQSPFFFHPFFAQSFCRPFCHSAFFFGAPAFAAPPVAFVSPPVYYAPPPQYYYPPAPPAAAPPPAAHGGSGTQDCRPYETTITIDGQPQRLVGTVCKGSDGNWHPAP